MGYEYINNKGTFKVGAPHCSSYMYFPLCNEAGLKSSVSPDLHGDVKFDQNSFLMMPVSNEDLHNSASSRNFFVLINGEDLWSLTGNSALQKTLKGTNQDETTSLEAGFLYHKITRTSNKHGLTSVITSYVPSTEDMVELTEFKLTNSGDEVVTIEPTSAIPLYGRSADNYRDHRNVTSLLHRIETNENGIRVKPTLSFDERGHQVNTLTYGLAATSDKCKIAGHIETQEVFIGEGGSLDWPLALFNRVNAISPVSTSIDGYEAMGAVCFESIDLKPGDEVSFYIGAYIVDENKAVDYDAYIKSTYCHKDGFSKHLSDTETFWQNKVDVVSVEAADKNFGQWMKWVNLQPILRRIYGCSFLPHHDYGRGGRGWRDLWQDCLALLLMEPEEVGYLLYNNFAGVRIDGTNATIIGSNPGEFVADRNNISRTWMDHGAWPWLTTKEYIHQSGDTDFLFKEQVYFKDQLSHRSKKIDEAYGDDYGTQLKDITGNIHKGSILEHLLLQNVSIFYNVGAHNILKLEDADWNDALDMAHEKGESVAFSCLYASNLKEIAEMLRALSNDGKSTIMLTREIAMLFDSVDYDSVEAKQKHLSTFFDSVLHNVSGKKVAIGIDTIIENLEKKYEWMVEHIRQQEFITSEAGDKWFNSYYDNNGNPVEGDHENGIRVMLTGQVFALMGGIATKSMAKDVVATCKKYLFDKSVGGYRLNTNFKEIKHDLGRGFGFAYGHKENGAMFSHMAIMYANALFKQGFIDEATELIDVLYKHCADFDTARIYPSIPEYVNERGRGMYTYLTGSASWLLYTVVTEMYGCKTHLGNLLLQPKLSKSVLASGKASIQFLFDEKPLTVHYHYDGKGTRSESGHAHISYVDGFSFEDLNGGALIDKVAVNKFLLEGNSVIDVYLQ